MVTSVGINVFLRYRSLILSCSFCTIKGKAFSFKNFMSMYQKLFMGFNAVSFFSWFRILCHSFKVDVPEIMPLAAVLQIAMPW